MRKSTFIFTEEWSQSISEYLIKIKKLHALSYEDIATKLKTYDIDITPKSLAVRFSSGKLSSNLLAASLIAMGESSVNLKTIEGLYLQKINKDGQ
ncbi:DUF6471 domain-containing protein [Marinicella sp. W31]|uniref:DUF6471 domain-containing protein n=1 Tax=Marinicella sp. W31 TaxID=3023713 RepID=UPI003756E2A1